ncbi:spore cortex-lytic enzyme [Clostridium ganghwense]|uniref:Spore cortex-lytic enzyme n=1 Tax=Clostridium ganghwense TaxID=312089 RepID=A0ABT4CKG8_9CLOT|nr:spore cortex-lytic enzyme [Clostridium ganghwense]MCY6369545.1 spore cortex-lytic enzyme [Clostridium ganghwense]
MRNKLGLKRISVLVMALLLTYGTVTECIYPYFNVIDTVSYRYGSKGEVVKEIQTKLKRWGYYTKGIDGIYGYQTYTSVKYFQRKNGLIVDGIVGNQTLGALGINPNKINPESRPSSSSAYNDKDVNLLARLINGEARGEPYEGQVAVGAVILNRVRNPKFPSTIAGVIYQPGAFTAIVDGQVHAEMKPNSIKAARDALNGWDPSGGAIYYFNPVTATSAWIWSRPLIKVIGKHRFCR